MTRALITGMAGFLGSHLTDYLLRQTDWELVGLVRLSHSGNLNRLAQMPAIAAQGHRVRLVHHDLRSPISAQLAQQIGPVDIILHIGASTHVDRSISDPMAFVLDNVVATVNLLEYARGLAGLRRFLYFSTDEVFGPSDGHYFDEIEGHHAANPYAATKSGAEQLCWAYHNTYKLPVILTRCMNIIGETQHVEKLLPLCIKKILAGEEVFIHADPTCTIPGARSYIHASNVADALCFILEHGAIGEAYHIVGEREIDNLTMATMISEILQVPLRYRLVDFHSSRPGHDILYRMDGSKLAALGWKPPLQFEASLRKIVTWSVDHPEWL